MPDLRDACFTALTGGRKAAAGAGDKAGAAAAASAASAGAPLTRIALADLKALVQRGLLVYEREERDLNVVLFQEAMDHVVAIDR